MHARNSRRRCRPVFFRSGVAHLCCLARARARTAYRRVQKLKEDYAYLSDLLAQCDKREEATRTAVRQRNDLLGASDETPRSTSRPANASASVDAGRIMTRDSHFLQRTDHHLDTFLTTGRLVLNDLTQQSHSMKAAHRKLLDAAHLLGVSGKLIRFIERRSTQDKLVFFALFLVLLVAMYLAVRFLRR
jgi:Golgi SNAP receptor complex protein 2